MSENLPKPPNQTTSKKFWEHQLGLIPDAHRYTHTCKHTHTYHITFKLLKTKDKEESWGHTGHASATEEQGWEGRQTSPQKSWQQEDRGVAFLKCWRVKQNKHKNICQKCSRNKQQTWRRDEDFLGQTVTEGIRCQQSRPDRKGIKWNHRYGDSDENTCSQPWQGKTSSWSCSALWDIPWLPRSSLSRRWGVASDPEGGGERTFVWALVMDQWVSSRDESSHQGLGPWWAWSRNFWRY